MRLFIAILPTDKQRERLLASQQLLRHHGDGRFTHPADLHLTLAFLGECEPEPIISVLQSLPRHRAMLQLDGAGKFGTLIWAGVQAAPCLMSLQSNLVNQLRGANCATEVREFIPHITLCRRYHGVPDFSALSAVLYSDAEPVETIHLMQTTPEGYRSLFSQTL